MRYDQTLATKKPQSKRRRSSKRNVVKTAPKPNQWRNWKSMKFCAVEDSRIGERLIFNVGDDVRVLNNGWDPNESYNLWDSWVGNITDIRGNSPRNTWVNVQWYYSGDDIAKCHPENKPYYGKFERSLSQDRQMISTLSINGKATVIDYDDTSSDQEPIPSECFYTRRTYNSLFNSLEPQPDVNLTCICGKPYNPDESDSMHFCPRFGCRQWYHESCLLQNGHLSNKSPDERTQELLGVPRAQVEKIPPDLLRLACTPIIRGGDEYGVVGNVKVACEAREWVYAYVEMPWSEGNPVPLLNGNTLDRWLDGLEGVEVEELIYPDDEYSFACKRGQHEVPPLVTPYLCPSCGKEI